MKVNPFPEVKRLFLRQGVDPETLSVYIGAFKKLKDEQKIKDRSERDIDHWGKLGWEAFKNYVDAKLGEESKSSKKESTKKSGASLVGESDTWAMFQIHTWEASCHYGAGTKWCITSKDGPSYFNDYSSDNNIYFLILKKDGSLPREMKLIAPNSSAWDKIAILVSKHGDLEIYNSLDENFSDWGLYIDYKGFSQEKELLSFWRQFGILTSLERREKIKKDESDYCEDVNRIEQKNDKRNKRLNFLSAIEAPIEALRLPEWYIEGVYHPSHRRGKLEMKVLAKDLHLYEGCTVDTEKNGGQFIGFKFPLPDGMTTTGAFNLGSSTLKKLPSKLKVKGALNLNDSLIEELPEDLKVARGISLSGCKNIKSLPNKLKVINGFFDISYSGIEYLPDGMTIGPVGMDAQCSSLKRLPKNLTLTGDLIISDTDITEIPDSLRFEGKKGTLYASGCKLDELPESIFKKEKNGKLVLDGDLILDRSTIRRLPNFLKINGMLSLVNATLTEGLPENLDVKRANLIGSNITHLPSGFHLNGRFSGDGDDLLVMEGQIESVGSDVSGQGMVFVESEKGRPGSVSFFHLLRYIASKEKKIKNPSRGSHMNTKKNASPYFYDFRVSKHADRKVFRFNVKGVKIEDINLKDYERKLYFDGGEARKDFDSELEWKDYLYSMGINYSNEGMSEGELRDELMTIYPFSSVSRIMDGDKVAGFVVVSLGPVENLPSKEDIKRMPRETVKAMVDEYKSVPESRLEGANAISIVARDQDALMAVGRVIAPIMEKQEKELKSQKNPLKKGQSRKTITKNIKALLREGYAQKQAVAIAFKKAGLSYYDGSKESMKRAESFAKRANPSQNESYRPKKKSNAAILKEWEIEDGRPASVEVRKKMGITPGEKLRDWGDEEGRWHLYRMTGHGHTICGIPMAGANYYKLLEREGEGIDTGDLEPCEKCFIDAGVSLAVANSVKESFSVLVDGLHGIHVPEMFVKRYDMKSWDVSPELVKEIKKGPDSDGYWDAWEKILSSARHTDDKGRTFRLEHDQDLFAVED